MLGFCAVGLSLFICLLLSHRTVAQEISPPHKSDKATSQSARAELSRDLASIDNPGERRLFLQSGITEEDVQSAVRSLQQASLTHQRHEALLDEFAAAEQALDQERRLYRDWNGFGDQTAPYPLRLVDSLRESTQTARRDTEALKTEEMLLATQRRDIQSSQDSIAKEYRSVTEVELRDTDPLARTRASLRLRLVKARLAEVQALSLLNDVQTRLNAIQTARAQARLEWETRRLSVATSNYSLQEWEWHDRLYLIQRERDAQNQEIEAEEKRQATLAQRAARARDELEKIARISSTPAALRVATLESETASMALEYSARRIQQLRGIYQSYAQEASIWDLRYQLSTSNDSVRLQQAQTTISDHLQKIRLFEETLKARRETIRAQGGQLKLQIEQSSSPSEQKLLTEQQEILARTLTDIDAAQKRLDYFIGLMDRWREEVSRRRSSIPWSEQLTSLGHYLSGGTRALWNFEVFTAKDNILLGESVVQRETGITIGKIIFALLVLVLGGLLASQCARLSVALLRSRLHFDDTTALLIRTWVFYCLAALCLLTAMSMAHIPFTVFAFMGGALAIAIGFGAQNLINNFISGLLILTERPMKIGDIVEVDEHLGEITHIGARCSRLRKFDGVDILIPNSVFLEQNVVNWTLSDSLRRFEIKIGVAYGTNTSQVRSLLEKAAAESEALHQPAPESYFENFGDNALEFTLVYWLAMAKGRDRRRIETRIRENINSLLAEAGISISFPQRDLHVDCKQPLDVRILTVPDASSNSRKD
jgi:potassium-dependent mechanosensitive channel